MNLRLTLDILNTFHFIKDQNQHKMDTLWKLVYSSDNSLNPILKIAVISR